MQPATGHRSSNSSWINFDQPFEGFTIDRSLTSDALQRSPGSFWQPPAPRVVARMRSSPRLGGWFGWILRRLSLGCGLAVLAVGLFLGFTAYRLQQATQNVFRGGGSWAFALQEEFNPADLNQEGDSRVNLLLAGKGGPGHEGPNLTDSLIVVSFDPNAQSAAILSLPRDWQVELTSQPGVWVRINSLYGLVGGEHYRRTADFEAAEAAGLAALEETVEQKIGLPIHYHMLVDFNGFVALVDALGGIDLDIPERMYDERAELDLQPGHQTLNGYQALAYARARYTVRRGDFGRSVNQRQLLLAIKDKSLSLGILAIILKANPVISALDNSVVSNLSLDDAKHLYRVVQVMPPENITSLDLVSDPVLLQPQEDEGRAVLWPVAGRDNYADIQQFVRQQLFDSFISQEAATVAIWQAGVPPDPALVDQLASYGYQISASQLVDTPVRQPTLVINTPDAPYTASYLSKRFEAQTALPTDLDFSLTGPLADLILILTNPNEV